MALFDRDNEDESDGEVRLSMPDDDSKKEGKLMDEAEKKLGGKKSSDSSSGSSSGSGSGSGSMLPGVSSSNGSSSSSSSSGRSISRKDIHEQNQEIIELLNDIKKEVSKGGNNQLL